jgi:hypothetical protein
VAHKGHGKKMGEQRAIFFGTAHKGHRSHGKFSRKHRCKVFWKHHGKYLWKHHGNFLLRWPKRATAKKWKNKAHKGHNFLLKHHGKFLSKHHGEFGDAMQCNRK